MAARQQVYLERAGPALASRLLIAPLFLVSATMKISAPAKAAAMIGAIGLPFASLGVWGAAALEIALPILLIIGVKIRASALMLAAYCIATALLFHLAWGEAGQLINFLKNLAIAGGLVSLAVAAQQARDVEP